MVDPAGTDVAPTFDGVYTATWSRVVRTAFLIVGSRAVAEEIGQEAFLRLYRHFGEVENPGGFLRTAVVRLCLTWRDRASAEAARWRAVADPEPVGDPEVDEVWDALARLRPERRVALVLRYYEDLPYEEIAAVVGCRVSTARTRVHRALADLREELEP